MYTFHMSVKVILNCKSFFAHIVVFVSHMQKFIMSPSSINARITFFTIKTFHTARFSNLKLLPYSVPAHMTVHTRFTSTNFLANLATKVLSILSGHQFQSMVIFDMLFQRILHCKSFIAHCANEFITIFVSRMPTFVMLSGRVPF